MPEHGRTVVRRGRPAADAVGSVPNLLGDPGFDPGEAHAEPGPRPPRA